MTLAEPAQSTRSAAIDRFACCQPLAVSVSGPPPPRSAASSTARPASVFDILPLGHRPEGGLPSQSPAPLQSSHVKKAFSTAPAYQAQDIHDLEAQAKADKAVRML